ncbi:MAG: hypothetical protein JKY48_04615 [Flavobacteriales bacterium]|nr:hypothetical protein [Flavobacteriales bacterium]
MAGKEDFQKIVDTVKNKASLKQKIYRNTLDAFNLFKEHSKQLVEELVKEAASFDEGVYVSYQEKGLFEFQLKIGGDIILFHMHTNVFDFDRSNALWKTSYLKEDASRSFCGIINIYNFLSDSLKYNRYDDSGYLIGRTFVNQENHFFVEGKRQLNFIHNDFVSQSINPDAIRNIVQQAILYSMDFDLYTPPYDHVQEISVGQLLNEAAGMRVKTGKRVGFKFSFEEAEKK